MEGRQHLLEPSPGHSGRCRVSTEAAELLLLAPTKGCRPSGPAGWAGTDTNPSQELLFVANNCCGGSFCIKPPHKTFRGRTAEPNLFFSSVLAFQPGRESQTSMTSGVCSQSLS